MSNSISYSYIKNELMQLAEEIHNIIEKVKLKKNKEEEDFFELSYYAKEIYWLKQLHHPNADEYIKNLEEEDYNNSDSVFDNPRLLYYIYKLDFGNTLSFRKAYESLILEHQTRKGYIPCNTLDHVGPLSVLVAVDPHSEATELAIEYLITHKIKEYKGRADIENNYQYCYVEDIAIAILCLYEYNFYKYSSIIDELCLLLKQCLNRETYVKDSSGSPNFGDTCLAIEAISLLYGSDDSDVQNSLQWVKSQPCPPYCKSSLLSVLISADNALSIPYQEYRKLATLSAQQTKQVKSHLVSTLPFEGNVSIKTKIKEMLNPRNNQIWICSRFITEFWTDIINLKRDYPSIDLKIITIPQGEARSKCMGDGKKFVSAAFDALEKTLKSDFKTSDILHARFVITDTEVLVSSADFSAEQLEKEFNLGIWTTDEEVRKQCEDIFKRYWNNLS